MAYVYSEVEDLEKTKKVGSQQCVALLQHYARLPTTVFWKEGKPVMESGAIAKGTAIATFVNSKSQSLPTGNHAAFFLSKDANGMWSMDQWSSPNKKWVSKRHISRKGKLPSGAYKDPSNNADAYSIIE